MDRNEVILMRAVLGFGSNLGDREENIRGAISRLEAGLGKLCSVSPILETEPLVRPGVDASSYPKFLNAAALFETELGPRDILGVSREVERVLGRDRSAEKKRWEPRVIDIDILAVDSLVWNEPDLQIPHSEMSRRDFVLQPFFEVWPEWRSPVNGKTAAEMLADITKG